MTSLKRQAFIVLGNLTTEMRQDYRALVAVLESRFGAAHHLEIRHTKFKTRMRRRNESLQEPAEDIELLEALSAPRGKRWNRKCDQHAK